MPDTIPTPIAFSQLEDNLKKICRWEKDPVSLRGLFTELTRLHYSDPRNISTLDIPQLRNYIWDTDEHKSRIFIDVTGQFNTTILEKRPAIFVGSTDFDFIRSGIDNGVQNDLETGLEDRATEINTTMLFYHVATTEDEVLALARITAAYYLHFAEKFRKELKFHLVQVLKLGKPAILYESREHWVSVVSVVLKYFEAWQIADSSHKLKNIRLEPV